MSGARRVDQRMAAVAAELLDGQDVNSELRTRYRQLSAMFHGAGLAATYAFIAAKAGEKNDLALAYRRAGEAIGKRLAELGLLPASAAQLDVRAVMPALGDLDAVQYARASAEATALAGWLSRLADALHKEQSE
ncbi:MAG TPA: type III-B CRISPR module-associated protein Cmr5 [Streptosporangiaceae bacterium]|nr:type III-B CRISPR module-associated protein Cmr5 [Streptosporangiaceae bacterium]